MLDKGQIQVLINQYNNYPLKRQGILAKLVQNGQGVLAESLRRKAPPLVGVVKKSQPKKKKVPLLNSLFGLMGLGESDNAKAKGNVDRIAAVMIQAIADMSNAKLSETARVVALKNFEESRSTLEDTAKNYPDNDIRVYAMAAAQRVLNSDVAQKFFNKNRQSFGLGAVSGPYMPSGTLPYRAHMLGASVPDFMR